MHSPHMITNSTELHNTKISYFARIKEIPRYTVNSINNWFFRNPNSSVFRTGLFRTSRKENQEFSQKIRLKL